MARLTKILNDSTLRDEYRQRKQGEQKGVKILKPIYQADGDGLFLRISTANTASWVFRYNFNRHQSEMGLGSYPATTLSAARVLQVAARAKLNQNIDPIADKKVAKKPSFLDVLDRYLKRKETKWKGDAARVRFKRVFEIHAKKLLDPKLKVDQITKGFILSIIEPMWNKPRTKLIASVVQKQTEIILEHAKSLGYVKENVALMSGLQADLDEPFAHEITHRAAMHWRDVPAFIKAVRAEGISNPARYVACLSLEFTILTATRRDETREMEFSEIGDDGVWIVPATRMKNNKPHHVPLSKRALEIIEIQRAATGGVGIVFPGADGRSPIGASLLGVIIAGSRVRKARTEKRSRMVDGTLVTKEYKVKARSALKGLAGDSRVHLHGFRSSFATYLADNNTGIVSDIIDMCLAHTVGTPVFRTYQRSPLVDKRAEAFNLWHDHITA